MVAIAAEVQTVYWRQLHQIREYDGAWWKAISQANLTFRHNVKMHSTSYINPCLHSIFTGKYPRYLHKRERILVSLLDTIR